MFNQILDDLEAALGRARLSDLWPGTSRLAVNMEEEAAFSHWLPYRAYLADREIFVNRDAIGFCLELRPQSGADEEMARVLTALYAASPPGTGIRP